MDPIEGIIYLVKLIPKPILPYVSFIGFIGYGLFLGWLRSKSEE